jgi:hypothetical protein
MAPENHLTVRENGRIPPEDDQFTPADDQLMPADDQLMLAQHQIADEVSEPHPAGTWVTGDLGPPAAAVPGYPGLAPAADIAPVIDAAQEPGTADTGAGSSPASSVLVTEPESASAAPRVSDKGVGPWHEIQATFVDDPRASIELAASLVDDRVEAFVMFVKDRQQALQSEWEGDAGTEDLRMALQHYRALWNRLEDIRA